MIPQTATCHLHRLFRVLTNNHLDNELVAWERHLFGLFFDSRAQFLCLGAAQLGRVRRLTQRFGEDILHDMFDFVGDETLVGVGRHLEGVLVLNVRARRARGRFG